MAHIGRPPKFTGWWLDVLEELANGNVAVLASLFEVNTKTLHRWVTGGIKKLRGPKKAHCRMILGREFLPPKAGSKHGRRDCPNLFRNLPKVKR